jgi:hypothetical protein
MHVGPVERRVVVAPVPDDDLRLPFRPPQNLRVIDAGVHDDPLLHQRFVLFKLLDGAIAGDEIIPARKALDDLVPQIAIRHGMPGHDHLFALVLQYPANPAGCRRLAAAGPHAADRYHRPGRGQHGPAIRRPCAARHAPHRCRKKRPGQRLRMSRGSSLRKGCPGYIPPASPAGKNRFAMEGICRIRQGIVDSRGGHRPNDLMISQPDHIAGKTIPAGQDQVGLQARLFPATDLPPPFVLVPSTMFRSGRKARLSSATTSSQWLLSTR